MVAFRPFRGWRYNPDMVGDIASVLCPPYDLINPELQQDLYQLSPYNAVRLEASERLDSDDAANNRYTRAATVFDDWLKQRVLVRDQEPCCYLLKYGFRFRGQGKAQLSLIGCVRLEDYQRRVVLPHEYTWEPAVSDRLSLMKACNTNFSPIMGLYRDSAGHLTPVFSRVMAGEPVLHLQDRQEQDFTLWQITDPGIQEQLGQFFADRVVYLADGHHRYEAALEFRETRAAIPPPLHSPSHEGWDTRRGDATYNFVMMALIEFDDAGLMVLPYHRVVGGLAPPLFTRLRDRLHELFEIRPLDAPSSLGAEGILQRVEHHGRNHQVVGLVGPEGEGPYLLRLREAINPDSWGPLAVSEAWILEEQVLKPVLGDTLNKYLTYVHNHHLAMERVTSGVEQMAFLLNPFAMSQFEAIVGSGKRLPPKSTFFYPKLPTGLVINQLDGTT